MGKSLACLHDHLFPDVMQIEPASEQNDDHEHAHDLAILFVERIAYGLDVFTRNGCFKAWRDSHDKKSQSPNPHNGGHQMQPMIQNGKNGIEIEKYFLEDIH